MNDDAELRRARARVGTTLRGKYRLDSVLGVGGMAVVYGATHRNRKRFAVKMLHPELSLREDVRIRFVREGYVANSVEHPNALAVLDDDVTEDGVAFVVMELLDGATLDELWQSRNNRLPVREVLAIAHELLDVLVAAHQKAIVHRDIKPANVFVLEDGTVKVLDFGIARLRDAASNAPTHTGMMLGTPAFLPPEQALAKSSEIDHRTDIWAVGATMFTLLSGCLVHQGENAAQLVVETATKPARSLASVAGEIPAAVVSIVDKALAFEKTRRWESSELMRDAIRRAYASELGEPLSRAPIAALMLKRRNAGLLTTVIGDAPVVSTSPTATVQMDRLQVKPRSFVGGTTAQPVSSGSSTSNAPDDGALPSRPIRSPALWSIAALAVTLAFGGLLALPRAWRVAASAGSPDAETPSPASPSREPAPLARASDAPAADGDAGHIEAAAEKNGAPTASARPPASIPVSPRPASAEVRRAPTPPSSGVPPKNVSCDPNYTVDSAGHRILKRECL